MLGPWLLTGNIPAHGPAASLAVLPVHTLFMRRGDRPHRTVRRGGVIMADEHTERAAETPGSASGAPKDRCQESGVGARERRTCPGDPHYPLPWARTPTTCFLFTATETREATVGAVFRTLAWQDDTEAAKA